MKRRVLRRRQALADLASHVDYFRAQGEPELAERFLQAAKETFGYLADTTGSGCPCEFESERARDLLWWPIRGFRSHFIFFRHRADHVEVVRVLHASQNWQAIIS